MERKKEEAKNEIFTGRKLFEVDPTGFQNIKTIFCQEKN